MKVILTAKVEKLGKNGDVVDVSDGYARNFLFARGLATPATAGALQRVAGQRARALRAQETEMSQAGAMAAKLDGYELLLKERVSERGTLYAAIGSARVLDGLKKAGFSPVLAQVRMEPMKEPGEQEVTLEFPHGFEALIMIIVEAL